MKTIVTMTLLAMSLATLAHASVGNGYYKCDGNEVFVETVNIQGIAVSYGFVTKDNDNGALFRIEEVGDGTEAWIRLTQDQDGVLATNIDEDASYNGRIVNEDGVKIILAPTDYGRSNGAKEIHGEASSDKAWLPLPTSPITLDGAHGSTVEFSDSLITGKFSLGGQDYDGTFRIEPVVPGVGALHAESLNSETVDGRALDRKITAVAIMTKESGLFGSSKYLKLIQVSANALGPETSLEVQ